METMAAPGTLADVLLRLRPAGRLPLLLPVYALFEELLGELLLRGSETPEADIEQLLRELAQPGIKECASTYVYAEEFGRLVATAAFYGPGPLEAALVAPLWPIKDAEQANVVVTMMKLLQLALPKMANSAQGEGLRRALADDHPRWPEIEPLPPPARGRGRPADVVQQSLLVLGVREGLFRKGARPFDEVAAAIAAVSSSEPSRDSIYRRMKRVRRQVRIPEGWQATLLCERIAPLHAELFATAEAPASPLVVNWKKGRWPHRSR